MIRPGRPPPPLQQKTIPSPAPEPDHYFFSPRAPNFVRQPRCGGTSLTYTFFPTLKLSFILEQGVLFVGCDIVKFAVRLTVCLFVSHYHT